MTDERMQGYFECSARPGQGDGGVFSKAAFNRFQAGGPFTRPLPHCEHGLGCAAEGEERE